MSETPRPPATLAVQLRDRAIGFREDEADYDIIASELLDHAANAIDALSAALQEARAELASLSSEDEAWAEKWKAKYEAALAARDEARKALQDATGCTRQDCPCAFGDRHMWHQAYREKKAELDALKVQLEPKRPHHYDEDGFCACGAVEADESYRDIACTEEPSR